MLVDCESCTVRGTGCGECVVALLLDTPPAIHQLGEEEVNAIEVFALAGFEVTVLEPTHHEHGLPEPGRPVPLGLPRPRRHNAA